MSALDRIAAQVLERVDARAPGAEASVAVARTRHGLTRFANSAIHQHVGEDTTSVSLKVAVDGRVLTSDTSNVDGAAIERFVEAAIGQARLLPRDAAWPGVAGPGAAPASHQPDADTWDADPEERARVVAAFVAEGQDLQAAGFADTQGSQVLVATSAGQRLEGRTTRATLDGIHQTATSAGYGHGTAPALADLDGAGLGHRAADLARRSATTSDVPPGEYEVVLSPECVAEMLSFLAFYGLNAKEHQEGGSFARLGEQQFDPLIHLVDDATDPRALGLPFDIEGTPRRPCTFIDHGVTAALAHDRRTARRAGTTSTGHAIPGGDAWGAYPESLFLAPGTTSPDALVAGVERGLLVTQFNYVRILDPKSQVATGLTRNGTFLIEDGEVTTPVSNLRFTQSFLGALAPGNVVALGDDARFAACEFGNGIVHCPSARLANFRFTGGAAG